MLLGPAVLLLLLGTPQSPPKKLIAEANQALKKKAYKKARSLAEKATQKAPRNPSGWLTLGLAQFHIGSYEPSREAFHHAIRLAPDLAIARFSLGSASFQSGHYDEAEMEFLDAGLVNPKLAPLALLNAGFAANAAGSTEEAEGDLKAALAVAKREQQEPDVEEQVKKRAEALEAQIAQKRQAQTREQIMKLAHEGKEALLSGDPDLAILRFEQAHSLASHGSARSLDKELKEALRIAQSVKQGSDESRWTVELGLGTGWDSNAVQSGVIVAPSSSGTGGDNSAFFVSANLDVQYRPVGNAASGLALEYAVSQLAYATLSPIIDQYSIQEHNLGIYGTWTPHRRVTLEVGVEGFFVASGLATFQPFAVGGNLGPHLTIREPHGFVTRIEYEHLFKRVLPTDYAFLSGDIDDVTVTQSWRSSRLRLSVGYQYHHENVDYECTDLNSGGSCPTTRSTDTIQLSPFAYDSHEASLGGSVSLPWELRAAVSGRYEYRQYAEAIRTVDLATGVRTDGTTRVDHRASAQASLARELPHGLALELEYSFVYSFSTVDEWNFQKHLVELALTWKY
jgi:tetratricopeptide (TPR) repeat protein